MWSTAKEIAAGDVVIAWMTRDLIQPITITPGATLHNKFGYYPHNNLIGTPYGSKVRSQQGRGFIYVLRPTPELWTLALPHRTQILYLADISFITEWLGITKGSRVIEAGTGSGSFSHSVARTVGNTGKLYSFEFHEVRAGKAREEFERHGMSSFVTLQHRNVCKDGFAEITDEADAVFLDLPAPWDAIPHAKKALRKDAIARICCFSPCIEQVLRTVTALNEFGFTEITTYETLLRPLEVSTAPAFPSLDDLAERLKVAELKREEKRLRQIQANRERVLTGPSAKRKLDEVVAEDTEANGGDGAAGAGAGAGELEHKRLKTTNGAGEVMQVDSVEAAVSTSTPSVLANPTTATSSSSSPSSSSRTPITLPAPSSTAISSSVAVSKALPEVRGHTSYLTFACLVPYDYYKTPQNAAASANATPVAAATLQPALAPGTSQSQPIDLTNSTSM